MMYFYLGAFLFEKLNQIKKTMIGESVIISILSFAIYEYCLKCEKQGVTMAVFTLLAKSICSLVSVVMVYLIISKLCEKYTLGKNVWNRLKKDSMGIYLFHQQIIYLTIIPLNGKVHPLVQVMISFLIAIFSSSILVHLLRQSKILEELYGL